MPLDKLFNNDEQKIAQDPEVKTARAAVNRTLQRLETSVDRLAHRIENTSAVRLGWPLITASWSAFRLARKMPWLLLAVGTAAGGTYLYKRKQKTPKRHRRATKQTRVAIS